MKIPRTLVWIVFFLLGLIIISNGQENRTSEKDFKIQIGVEEVRIDAVVLDKKGIQVVDLTANDFEIYQDGKPQNIISCTYISDPRKHEQTIVVPETSKAELLVSQPKLSKDQIQRTVAFLINGSGADPRPHLKHFVESQMEPGDMVGILGAGLQTFSSDKRELLARINSISGRFSCIDSIPSIALTYEMLSNDPKTDEDHIREFKAEIAPIRYAVRALQDMPGRKYLIVTREAIFSDARKLPRVQNRLLNEAANEAWRAGVVISTWDYCNSQAGNYSAKFNILFKKTGGIYTDNNKFLYKGKPALDAFRGYYLLSYIPPATTFDNKNRDKYHQLSVYVKRPDVKVHSRDGFFGGAPGLSNFAAVPQANTLQQAMFSPLLFNDLKISLSSGYAHTPASGYFLRSWLHLAGKDLTFVEEKDGKHSLLLELQTLTSDSIGRIQDKKSVRYDFILNDAEILLITKHGLDLKTYLPVQNPGNYYVSAAIKDRASGKIGTGYQFIDIPDLKKLRLSLSDIFVFNNAKDASVIKSGNIQDDRDSFNTMRIWQALSKSPALRRYKPGDSFDYMTVVYNAKSKEGHAPKLKVWSTLFREGLIYRQEQAEDINLDGKDDLGRIPILKKLVLDSAMDEGDYLLQLTVADKPAAGKPRIAIQAIDIKIRKE
jgi:VWFA-related protein